MKAVTYATPGDVNVLHDVEVPVPAIGHNDLLVSVRAVSVNPVDALLRSTASLQDLQERTLGFDASGIVVEVGDNVAVFKPGDEVFYAGAIERQGSNSELHAVDARLVGTKPSSLSFAEAASLPLTGITAWELLFDRMLLPVDGKASGKTLLVLNGAGGVGSMLIQLARRVEGLTIVATASRPESAEWVRGLGAHHVIDHREPLNVALRAIGIQQVEYFAALHSIKDRIDEIADIIAPQGHISVIVDEEFNVLPLKAKSVSISWEMVFTRSLFATEDMSTQKVILDEIATLVDARQLRHTMTRNFGALSAKTLQSAHRELEAGRTVGKLVLTGFEQA